MLATPQTWLITPSHICPHWSTNHFVIMTGSFGVCLNKSPLGKNFSKGRMKIKVFTVFFKIFKSDMNLVELTGQIAHWNGKFSVITIFLFIWFHHPSIFNDISIVWHLVSSIQYKLEIRYLILWHCCSMFSLRYCKILKWWINFIDSEIGCSTNKCLGFLGTMWQNQA